MRGRHGAAGGLTIRCAIAAALFALFAASYRHVLDALRPIANPALALRTFEATLAQGGTSRWLVSLPEWRATFFHCELSHGDAAPMELSRCASRSPDGPVSVRFGAPDDARARLVRESGADVVRLTAALAPARERLSRAFRFQLVWPQSVGTLAEVRVAGRAIEGAFEQQNLIFPFTTLAAADSLLEKNEIEVVLRLTRGAQGGPDFATLGFGPWSHAPALGSMDATSEFLSLTSRQELDGVLSMVINLFACAAGVVFIFAFRGESTLVLLSGLLLTWTVRDIVPTLSTSSLWLTRVFVTLEAPLLLLLVSYLKASLGLGTHAALSTHSPNPGAAPRKPSRSKKWMAGTLILTFLCALALGLAATRQMLGQFPFYTVSDGIFGLVSGMVLVGMGVFAASRRLRERRILIARRLSPPPQTLLWVGLAHCALLAGLGALHLEYRARSLHDFMAQGLPKTYFDPGYMLFLPLLFASGICYLIENRLKLDARRAELQDHAERRAQATRNAVSTLDRMTAERIETLSQQTIVQDALEQFAHLVLGAFPRLAQAPATLFLHAGRYLHNAEPVSFAFDVNVHADSRSDEPLSARTAANSTGARGAHETFASLTSIQVTCGALLVPFVAEGRTVAGVAFQLPPCFERIEDDEFSFVRELHGTYQKAIHLALSLQAQRRLINDDLLRILGHTGFIGLAPGRQVPTDVACVFFDIRNYTQFCERATRAELEQLNREIIMPITRVAALHGGRVTNFIGDALLITFHEDFENAVFCVLAMLAELPYLQRYAFQRAQEAGMHPHTLPVEFGIGASLGLSRALGRESPCDVAIVQGTDERVTLTVLGATINRGARLQTMTKALGCRNLVLRELHDYAISKGHAVRGRRLGRFRLRGVAEGLELCELLSPAIEDDRFKEGFLKPFEAGVDAYFEGRFEEAFEIFDTLEEVRKCECPHLRDGPLEFFVTQSRSRTARRPTDWIGVEDFSG